MTRLAGAKPLLAWLSFQSARGEIAMSAGKGIPHVSNCLPVSTVRHRTRGVGARLVSSAVHLLVLVGIMAVPLLPPTGRRVSEVTVLSFNIKRT